MSWKMSPYMSQTLGYVTTCPEHQHLSPHVAHTFGCASMCVLQLKGVTVSPHSLQALLALGRQGWDLGMLEKCGSPLPGDTAHARVHSMALPKPQCHL